MKKIKICPECHSQNIKEDWKLRGTIYECNKCGYRGVLVIELPKVELKRLRKNDKSIIKSN